MLCDSVKEKPYVDKQTPLKNGEKNHHIVKHHHHHHRLQAIIQARSRQILEYNGSISTSETKSLIHNINNYSYTNIDR